MRLTLFRFFTFFRASRAEAELAREVEAHLQLLEDDGVARGMSRDEAYFAARRMFGGQVEQMKVRHRETRSFRLLDQSWLDIKLAVRMLARFPGLTVVGTIGMATAMAIAAGGFAIISTMLDPALPLDEGDRIVAVQLRNVADRRAERRILHEFAEWRGGLRTIADLSAFRQVTRNLILPNASPDVVRAAEMSAAGFRVARVAPLVGRHLVDADERAGAEPVAVISEAEWRRRFQGDPAIVGRAIQLGAAIHTIVGVMPEGFAFPVNHHYWLPLRLDAAAYGRLEGPELWIFGRLAPESTLDEAQAELTAIGQRLSHELPATHAPLRSQVTPYTHPFTDMDEPENVMAARVMQFLLALLLALVALNVAILVYARTVTRHAEIAVRSALGASRRRIVAQLFIEALALSLLATVVALGVVGVALREIEVRMLPILGELPFWLEFRLTPGAVAIGLVLGVAAAAIVGIVPALKATGRHVQRRLQNLSAGGAGMRLGTTWTALVVAQVAVAVALLPTAVYHAWDATRHVVADPGFPSAEFLRATVVLDPGVAGRNAAEANARYGNRLEELMRRLREDADVRDVTFSLAAPGEENVVWVDVGGLPLPAEADDYTVHAGTAQGHRVRLNRIAPGWTETFEVPVLAGRHLTAADAAAGTAVLVNRSFADAILGGSPAVGRQFRFVGVSGDSRPEDVTFERWHDIVGVIADFPVEPSGVMEPRVYQAVSAGDMHPALISIHTRARDATSFAPRLREITAAVDPTLQLRGVNRIDAPAINDRSLFRMLALALITITLSVVVLSAAGIYALMSVTVEQRRREIGIRTALGADPRRLLATIFARALAQLGIGAGVGMGVALLLETASTGELMAGYGEIIVPVVALFMMAVGLVAALGPARRGLRVHPTEALRAE